jgi:hypothetical protein
MAIDMASVYAARYRRQPNMLRAAVMGQSPDPKLDSYTALNALRLVKEADMMDMAGKAQQPTSAPSILAENLAPPAPPQGLAGMIPMGAPAGQMPQRAPMPQPTMQAASGGLAGMYTPEEDYAEGGIVAFQRGGLNSGEDMEAIAANDDATKRLVSGGDGEGESVGLENLMFTSKGDPQTYAALAAKLPGAINEISDFEYKGLTPQQRRKVEMDEIAAYREAMGPNVAMNTLMSDIASRKSERSRNLEEGKGVALLKAAYAVTQGNNWARAFAGAGAAFGEEYNRALQADKAEKRSIAIAEFNVADAQRKENLGLFKEGRAAGDRAVAAQAAAERARFDKTKAVADALNKGMNVTKPLRSAFGGAGAGGPKPLKVPEDAAALTKQIITLEAKDPNDPQIAVLKKQREGLLEILSTGREGPTVAPRAAAALTAKQNNQVLEQMKIWEGGLEARKAKAAGNYDKVAAAKKEAFREDALRGVFDGGEETPSVITPKPKNTGKMPPPPAGFNPD